MRQRHEQVFHVPAVAQDRVGDAGCLDGVFGAEMIGRKRDDRGLGVRHRGIEDVLGAGFLGGRDGGEMLVQALARLVERVGGDDQDAVSAGKGPVERRRIVEVGHARLHALADIVGKLCRVAAGGDDVGRLDLAG
ncbi:hypothetical protein D3C71_1762810 [compost metagenome]